MTLIPFRPRDDDRSAVPDDATTRALRAEYASPEDGYWDGLEARVMAAVSRAAAAAGQAPMEWWQALAGWTRPALAAAAVALFAAGAAMFQARDARANVAFQAVIDGTPVEGSDVVPIDPNTSEVEELLRAGVERPRRRSVHVRAESAASAAARGGVSDEVLRYVQPE